LAPIQFLRRIKFIGLGPEPRKDWIVPHFIGKKVLLNFTGRKKGNLASIPGRFHFPVGLVNLG